MTDAALQAVVDKEAIRDVILRYCRGADRCDEELIRSAYHPEALDDHGRFRGTGADFASWVVGVMRQTSIATQHTVPNILIELEGDRARVETSFVAYHAKGALPAEADGNERVDVFGGRYLDRFERRQGQWGIAERTVLHDWSLVLRGTPFPFRDTYEQGRRDGSDPVLDRETRQR